VVRGGAALSETMSSFWTVLEGKEGVNEVLLD
jgi:hypothetical protein